MGPRAGLDTEATGKILSSLPGIEPRSLGSPTRSQTLYRLSYLAHNYKSVVTIILLYTPLQFNIQVTVSFLKLF
jgi:hypothetical protein